MKERYQNSFPIHFNLYRPGLFSLANSPNHFLLLFFSHSIISGGFKILLTYLVLFLFTQRYLEKEVRKSSYISG